MKYVHLDESDLEPPLAQCPTCGSSGFPNANDQILIQERPKVSMKECSVCHAVSASRMPTDEYLAKLYEPSVYSSSLSQNDQLSARCAARILENYPGKNPASLSILDYGGGNGNLAKSLVEQCRATFPSCDVTATVVDIYPREDDGAVRFVHVDSFMRSSERYDFVLASAVLEHLPAPRSVFEKLFRSGNEDALFYARTPYEITLAKYLAFHGVRWPRHLHDMGPAFWETYCANNDVEVLRSQTSIVETTFTQKFLYTLAAYCLKSFSKIETGVFRRLFPNYRLRWHIVGGWEIYARLSPA